MIQYFERNGIEILRVRECDNITEKDHHCMTFNTRLINETDTHKYFQSTKFNIYLGQYEDDFTDEMQIEIDGQMYTPANGLITIVK